MQAKEKFLDFLEEYIENNINERLKKIALSNKHTIEYQGVKSGGIKETIQVSDEEAEIIKEIQNELKKIKYIKSTIQKEYKSYFIEFDFLSKYLILSRLNARELFEIISDLIANNIEEYKEFKETHPDCTEAEFPIIDYNKLCELNDIEAERIDKNYEYLEISETVMSKKEIAKRNYVIRKTIDMLVEDSEQYAVLNNDFERYYFNQIDSYNQEDINQIISILENLKVDKQLTSKIKVYLTKDLEKRNKQKVQKDEIKKRKETIKNSNLLTDKEYKTIKKELRNYFDFYNVQKIKDLTEDEIMYCIELLIKIDEPIIDIQRFISFFKMDEEKYIKYNLNLLEKNNPISLYIELYNKLKFYESKLQIETNLNYIKDCLQEMFICSSEEYEFFKNEIENELFKILTTLPQTYEYEINETEKRIKLK